MRRIFKLLLKYKKVMIFPTICLLLNMVLEAVNPFLYKRIIDDALPNKNFKLLVIIAVSLLLVTLSRALFGFFKEYIFDKVGLFVLADLKDILFNHMQSLHFKYFDNMNTGELMSRLGEDIENIWRSLSFGFRLLIESGLNFIIALIVLSFINFKLTAIIFITILPIAYLAVSFEKKIDKNFEDISDQTAILNTTAQENIAGVRLVKAFARENHEMNKFFEKNKRNFDLNNEQAVIIANNFPIIELLTSLSIVLMIGVGALFVIRKEMTLGDLAIFSNFIWNLIWPLRELGWLMNMAAQFKASTNKIVQILDTPSEVYDKDGLVKTNITGSVEFKNVTFAYNDEVVLKDISFKANAGDTVAIMGTTGSGKSSIISLIGRYYNHQKGQVLVDGKETNDILLDDLRGSMTLVPQDTFLFSDSIRANIRFGARKASDEEIMKALEIAKADFVSEFEEGLDTIIGERGVGLSGGQKQRIAIARSIIRKSPILILDDSTSALDMETEYQLLKNLKSLEHTQTTFIIAHRISAVKNADIILYMENGKIVEQGNHNELLKQKGKYYEIYQEQFKDFDSLMEVK